MSGRAWPLGIAATVVLGGPAAGQSMPGMDHPAPTKPKPAAKPKKPSRQQASPPKAALMRMPMTAKPAGSDPATQNGESQAAMPGMAGLAGMSGGSMAGSSAQDGMTMTGTALPAGNAPPPPVPTDFYADRTYPAAADERARALVMHQQGGQAFYQVLFNLAEYQAHAGRDGYRWDGEAWFGVDINRVTLRTEGEGTRGEGVDAAEVQLLYSRAIGPYFNLQGGVRQDVGSIPRRTYLTAGVEGLAPYMFQTEARLFVATNGDVLGRLEGWYDQRLTQRLVLQPRVELNLAAQNDRRTRVGGGLTDAELGLRLRYEVSRQFAPYIGVSYEANTGRTADYFRAVSKDPTTTSLVAGVRFWF